MKSLKFREMLALELIGNYCTRKRAGRSRSRTIRSLPMLHFPARFPTAQKGKVLSAEKTKKEWTHNGFVKNVTCGCVTLALSMIVFCLGTKETNYINIYPVLILSFFIISMQTLMF